MGLVVSAPRFLHAQADDPPDYIVSGGGPIQAGSTLIIGASYNGGFRYINVDAGYNLLLENLTLVVNPFGSVSAAHSSNELATVEALGMHVINQGVITADNPNFNRAVLIQSSRLTNSFSGVINGNVTNWVGFDGYFPATVINEGTINGGVVASLITNEAGAGIRGTVVPALYGGTAVLNNFGTIGTTTAAQSIFVPGGRAYTIVNEMSGTLTGDVWLNDDDSGGTFVNHGTLNGRIFGRGGASVSSDVTLHDTTVFGPAATSASARWFTLAGSGANALPGDYQLSIGGDLVKTGSGVWTLNGHVTSGAVTPKLDVQGGSVIWGNFTSDRALSLRLRAYDFDAKGKAITFSDIHSSPGATLRDSAGGALINVEGGAFLGGGTVSAALRTAQISVSGAVTLSAPVTTPSSTLALTIDGHALSLQGSAALPSTTQLALNSAGAALQLNGRNQTLAALTGVSGTTVDLGGGNLTLNSNAALTFNGTLQGDGVFTKQGSGTFTLAGHSLTNAIEVQGGTLRLTPGPGVVGGSYRLNFFAGLEFAVNNVGAETTYAGGISDGTTSTGIVVKSGAGTLRFTGPNTFNGLVAVTAGKLILAHDNALGSSATLVNGPTAELVLATPSFAQNVGVVNGGTLRLTDTTTFSGQTSVESGSHFIAEGASTFNALAENAGSFTLRNNARADAATIINSGAFAFENSAQLLGSSVTNSGTILFRDSANAFGSTMQQSNGTLDLSALGFARALNVAEVAGDGFIRLGARALNLGGSGRDVVFSGSITDGGVAGGIGGQLNYSDTFGTLTLTGANTYTGGTTLVGGSVFANNTSGSAFGSGQVVVEAGAQLGGNGFIGGETLIEAFGCLAPGNSIGTLTFTQGLTLADGAFLNFELGDAISDLLLITGGNFNLGAVNFIFTATDEFVPGTFTLIDWTGANVGPLYTASFHIDFESSPPLEYSFAIVGSTLQLTAVSAVPEPSTYALLLGAVALALVAQRRRLAKPHHAPPPSALTTSAD